MKYGPAVALLALPTLVFADSAVVQPDALLSVDHVVYATPDLQGSVDELERRLGVRASPGGSHTGAGTRNALLALGPRTYLEIVGPDPEQPEPAQPRPFGIDTLKAPKFVAWAIRGSQLDDLRARVATKGVALGAVMSVERQRSDGVKLHWQMTIPSVDAQVGLIPFYIDWGKSPHPALTAAQGLTLTGLRAEHPNPAKIESEFKSLGFAMQVTESSEAALIATFEGPLGRVELR